MSDRGLHRIEDDLADDAVETFAESGIDALDAMLKKHAAFADFLRTRGDE